MGSIYKASPNVGLQLGFPHYCKKLIARDSSKWHPVFFEGFCRTAGRAEDWKGLGRKRHEDRGRELSQGILSLKDGGSPEKNILMGYIIVIVHIMYTYEK